jgi:hypothetical protein
LFYQASIRMLCGEIKQKTTDEINNLMRGGSVNSRPVYKLRIMKHSVKTIAVVFFLSFGFSHCKSSQKKETTSAGFTTTVESAGEDLPEIIRLADAFKASLTEEQRVKLQLPYSKTDAAKWSNLPAAFSNAQHVGLAFEAMTPAQIEDVKALLKAISGSTQNEGYDELQQLLNADDYLHANGGGREYGASNYYIAFLGIPAEKGMFEIQFGGHHLAFANTYKDGVLVGATPSFRGVEPFGTFTMNNKTNQPMNQEQQSFSSMLSSLSSSQLAEAKLSGTYSDLLLGPHKDGVFPTTASGIRCDKLSATQKMLVLSVIKTYVDDIDNKDAQAIMKRYTGELNDTYISYTGTTTVTAQNDYVRIDGPSVWIEYSSQHGVILSATHPHSVWRDKRNDYGGN